MADQPRESPPPSSEPPGSIVDRFRGTEWETRPDVPPPSSGTPASRVVTVVAVVLIVAFAGVALALLPWRGPAATPFPSRVILTPPPTPGPGDLIELAFWDYVASPTLNYHESIKVVQTTGPKPLTERLSLDVYVDDFDGTAVVEAEGAIKPTHFVLLRSGGLLYAKRPRDKNWQNALVASQFSGLHARPFLSLEDPRQLVYDGQKELDGATVHRLVSTELYRPDITRLIPLGIGSAPSAEIDLVLLVTAEGMPIEAQLTAHIPANLTYGTKAADLETVYQFSEQGRIEPIPSPRF